MQKALMQVQSHALSIDRELVLHKLSYSCVQENEAGLQQVREEAASAQRQYEQRREEQVGYGGEAKREEQVGYGGEAEREEQVGYGGEAEREEGERRWSSCLSVGHVVCGRRVGVGVRVCVLGGCAIS